MKFGIGFYTKSCRRLNYGSYRSCIAPTYLLTDFLETFVHDVG